MSGLAASGSVHANPMVTISWPMSLPFTETLQITMPSTVLRIATTASDLPNINSAVSRALRPYG